LNGSDAKSAQIFTLVHELVHLWLGESGVSNPDYRRRSQEQNHPIERICDGIAAEALVPKNTFLSGWNQSLSTEANLRNLTRYFKVSQVVTLRRAYELEVISGDEFSDYYLNQIVGNGAGSQGGGDFKRNLLVRNSRTFTTALIEAVLSGRTSEREAAHLLNLQVPSLDHFTSRMVGES
jgi:Zn-dependent peptidase ImmA (M78 family)